MRLLAVLLAGCAVISPGPYQIHGRVNERVERLEQAYEQPPEERVRVYTAFLEREKGFDQEYAWYRQALSTDLDSLGSKGTKFSEDGATGVPAVFVRRLDGVLLARRELAAAYTEMGTFTEAREAIASFEQTAERQVPTAWGLAGARLDGLQLRVELAQREGDQAGIDDLRGRIHALKVWMEGPDGVRSFWEAQRFEAGTASEAVYWQTQKAVRVTNGAREDAATQIVVQVGTAIAKLEPLVKEAVAESLTAQMASLPPPMPTPQQPLPEEHRASHPIIPDGCSYHLDAGACPDGQIFIRELGCRLTWLTSGSSQCAAAPAPGRFNCSISEKRAACQPGGGMPGECFCPQAG